MYDDFPEEAKGLKYFLKMVTVALVGVVVWILVTHPMNGDASSTTTLAVTHQE